MSPCTPVPSVQQLQPQGVEKLLTVYSISVYLVNPLRAILRSMWPAISLSPADGAMNLIQYWPVDVMLCFFSPQDSFCLDPPNCAVISYCPCAVIVLYLLPL